MMLISKGHDTLLTFVVLFIGMRDHVSFQMRTSFESFIAALLFADILSMVRMSLAHVSIKVPCFSELFLAFMTNVSSLLFFSELC